MAWEVKGCTSKFPLQTDMINFINATNPWIRKLAASRFFTVSVLLHVIFLIFFGGAVLFDRVMEPPDFESDAGNFVQDGQAAATPPPVRQVTKPVAPPPQPKFKAITVDSATALPFTMPVAPIVAPTFANLKTDTAAAIAMPKSGNKGFNLPATMRGRTTQNRTFQMGKTGGKHVAEQSVTNALRWLMKVQNPNGTWGKAYTGAMTGLATLCFLGHGETPQSGTEFSGVVSKVINAYVDEGTKTEGRTAFRGKSLASGPASYEHGIGTYALCEAYTMSKDERLIPIIKKAVGYIIDGQGSDGGWMYGYDKTTPSDTSVSGWQIQALKAAYLTDLMTDQVSPALDKSMKNLERVFNRRNGAFGYRTPSGDYRLTGVGVLCKIYWQGHSDSMVKAGIKNIMDGPPVKYDDKTANLYAWYYHTQACFMAGGDAWTKWNRLFQDEIVNHQGPDGFWPPNGGGDTGALGINPSIDGQVYRTALCTLMLEVFYRYLPTGKEHQSKTSMQMR